MLFPIELCGKGGRDVESLPSYLYRLSQSHGYSAGELLRALCRHSLESGFIKENENVPHHIKPGELMRPGKNMHFVKTLLERYTGQDLSSSYVWILEKSLGVSNGESTTCEIFTRK